MAAGFGSAGIPVRVVLLAFLLLLATNARAADTLLRIEILHVESTGYTMDCQEPGDDESGCIIWNQWNVYKARVKQVVSGAYGERDVAFAMYQHSQYSPGAFKDAYVFIESLKNLDTARKLGTPHVAYDLVLPRSYVCMDKDRLRSLKGDLFEEDPDFRFEWGGCLNEDRFSDADAFYVCDDLESEALQMACKERVVSAADKELVDTERQLRQKYNDRFDDGPWADVRSQAFGAFEKSAGEFRKYRKATCAFEATLSSAAEYRRKSEIECEYRMIGERVRMLYQQELSN